MKIFVVRHGQSEWNREHRICGHIDIPLSEEGRKQAEVLAAELKRNEKENAIRRIFVSPLQRARATAAPVEKALGIKAEIIEELRERHFGVFEGTDIRSSEFQRVWNEPFYRFEHGESPTDVASRIYPFLDRLRREEEGNVLLVCHGALMRIIATYFLSMTIEEYRAYTPSNCEIAEYEISN